MEMKVNGNGFKCEDKALECVGIQMKVTKQYLVISCLLCHSK